MSPVSPGDAPLPAPPALSSQERALQRLAVSRARLRGTMLPAESGPAGVGGSTPSPTPFVSLGRLWRRLRKRWNHLPAVDLALTAAQGWWAVQPWRPVAERATSELHGAVVPAVRRHPWAAVGLAVCAGAAVMAVRPWRWPLARAQWHHARRRVWHGALALASQWPLQATLSGLAAVWASQPGPREPTPEEAPADNAASATPVP